VNKTTQDTERQANRQEIADRFREREQKAFCHEGEKILKYYVLFGHEGLPSVLTYLDKMGKTPIRGLENDGVDQLINRVLDDEEGYLAYKLGLVREAVDGMEIDDRLTGLVSRFLAFLGREGNGR